MQDDIVSPTGMFKKKSRQYQSDDNLDSTEDAGLKPVPLSHSGMSHAVSLPHIMVDNQNQSAAGNIGEPITSSRVLVGIEYKIRAQ